jgi:hypothetical protein
MAEASFRSFIPLSHSLMPQPDKLEYPSDIAISQHAKDLIGGLSVKPAVRLGSGPTGVDELRHHPFFSVHFTLLLIIASSFILHSLLASTDNRLGQSQTLLSSCRSRPSRLGLKANQSCMRVFAHAHFVVFNSTHRFNTDSTRTFRRFSGKNFNSAETSYPSSVQRAAKTAQVFLLMSLSSMIQSPRYPSLLRLCARYEGGQSCQTKTLMLSP